VVKSARPLDAAGHFHLSCYKHPAAAAAVTFFAGAGALTEGRQRIGTCVLQRRQDVVSWVSVARLPAARSEANECKRAVALVVALLMAANVKEARLSFMPLHADSRAPPAGAYARFTHCP